MRPLPTTLTLFGAALGFVVILAPDAPLLNELFRARMSGWVAMGALLGSLSMPLLVPAFRSPFRVFASALCVWTSRSGGRWVGPNNRGARKGGRQAARRPGAKRAAKSGSEFGMLALARFGRVAPWRRALGVTGALFATVHAALVLPTDLVPDLRLLIYEPLLRAGAATLVALVVLAVTSFGAVARRVPRWKDLHALAYVAGALAALHLALSPHAWAPAPLAVCGLLATSVLFRAADKKRW